MDYRIIAADAAHGQIQVTYSDNGVDVATYAIDVPIEDGKYITGDKLDAEIRSREPIWLLQRRAMAAAAEDFHHIAAMVEAPDSSATPSHVDYMPLSHSTVATHITPVTVV